jgi:hypothetical protein
MRSGHPSKDRLRGKIRTKPFGHGLVRTPIIQTLNFSKLLTVFLLSSSVGWAASGPTGYENDVPDAIIAKQRVRFDEDNKHDVDFFYAAGTSLEAIVSAFKKTTKLTDFSNVRVLGFVGREEEASEITHAVGLPEKETRIFQIDYAGMNPNRQTRVEPRRSGRFPASDPKGLSRLELLRIYENLHGKLTPQESKTFEFLGESVLKTEFNSSARRWILVGARGLVAGGASAITLTLSSVHPVISLPIVAATLGVSAFFQAKTDWYMKYSTKTTPVERWFRRIAASFRPAQPGKAMIREESSFVASTLKWGSIELSANEFIKLTGLGAFALSGETIPNAYQFLSGAADALTITGNTVLTQGIYEPIIQKEFEKRTRPYHTMIAYYTDLLSREMDPARIKEFEKIVASCKKLALRERIIRSAWLIVGTASWTVASALRVLPNPIYSTIASYSLLGVGYGFRTYASARRLYEQWVLGGRDQPFLRVLRASIQDSIYRNCRRLLQFIDRSKSAISIQISRVFPY